MKTSAAYLAELFFAAAGFSIWTMVTPSTIILLVTGASVWVSWRSSKHIRRSLLQPRFKHVTEDYLEAVINNRIMSNTNEGNMRVKIR